MSLKTYIDLIEAFAAEVGLDAQALANTQEVVIDGLPIGLSYEGNEEFGVAVRALEEQYDAIMAIQSSDIASQVEQFLASRAADEEQG